MKAKEIYIVMYQAQKGEECSTVKAFILESAAEKFIKSMDSLPDEIEDENGYFWANDYKFPSECLYIAAVELEE